MLNITMPLFSVSPFSNNEKSKGGERVVAVHYFDFDLIVRNRYESEK